MWRSVFISTCMLLLSSEISDGATLDLTTNGPAYYKAPLAISAHLKGAPERTYNWIFMASLPNGDFERRLWTRDHKIVINETFNVDAKQVGVFLMSVRVQHTPFIFPTTIAYGEIKFALTNKIPVVVEFLQNGTKLAADHESGVLKVSSADILNATTRINDPTGYFQQNGTRIKIQWGLNNDVRVTNSSFARKYPSAADRVQDTLQMFMTADSPNDTYIADGSVSTVIQANDPVLGLNLTEKLWIRKGNLTHLDFKCNASPPIYYCFKYSSMTTNLSDFNCTDDEYNMRDICQFSITHYFGGVGDHEVMIAVKNVVNDILHWDALKNTYTVHIYNVPPKGLLRMFIVPISCVIMGTIVAVSGYALYEHTKGDMRVEVADFDFGGHSTREELDATLVERTFWTHLRDELAESSPVFHWLTRKRPPQFPESINDSTSTVKEDEDEPMSPEP